MHNKCMRIRIEGKRVVPLERTGFAMKIREDDKTYEHKWNKWEKLKINGMRGNRKSKMDGGRGLDGWWLSEWIGWPVVASSFFLSPLQLLVAFAFASGSASSTFSLQLSRFQVVSRVFSSFRLTAID